MPVELGTLDDPEFTERIGSSDELEFVNDAGTVVATLDQNGDLNLSGSGVIGKTFIKSRRASGSTSTTAGTWVNIADTEMVDSLNEQNQNLVINPSESGWYEISASALFIDGTDQDRLKVAVRNVDTGTVLTSGQLDEWASGALDTVDGTILVELTAGTNYEVQATNNDSSFRLSSGDSTWYTVRKSVLQP